MLNPDNIAEGYRRDVLLGTLTWDVFVAAMRQAFNAGELNADSKVVAVADHYRTQLAAKQREIDRLTPASHGHVALATNEERE